MCTNAKTPCPGCKKHEKADADWMFFTDDERKATEALRKRPALFDRSFLKPEPAHAGTRPVASNGEVHP
ncbi:MULTISPECIES: hypothetical protein [unclassified Ruegeria]|jgi:predicted Fe-S protein YdhL (DUF1289 family)|uniref:hypothetical protein n=1 Tax=unclassified Ruegeria TaxID=2625375 RepID=UPI0005905200|nr:MULTISPECIES: hypothetical protein [unclassified Ruegeria]KII16228.1 hypothetical protein OO25_07455 [Phaeobacter sp. S60]MBO9436188.1 hypothetical protein [Ruegeria sp. R13_0]MBO9448528.1 hypothetical protein [Ruegeria sp. R14_0]QFT75836.1 hypothetical protein FIU92_22510 [Ruegeria sp. THAF33]CAD0187114.1 hypothetical protein RUESEDTHA_04026 [Ruegeria sp. THAF57]